MPLISLLLRSATATLVALVLPLVAASGARAASFDPLGFQIVVPPGGLTVHENGGQAVIIVRRSTEEALLGGQVRYITSGDGFNPATNAPFDCGRTPCTATSDDFTSVQGELDFPPGETTQSFTIPIVDHATATSPKTLRISLFGPSPLRLPPPPTPPPP